MRLLAAATAGVGDYKKALPLYGELLKETPQDPDLYLAVGNALKTTGKTAGGDRLLPVCVAHGWIGYRRGLLGTRESENLSLHGRRYHADAGAREERDDHAGGSLSPVFRVRERLWRTATVSTNRSTITNAVMR